MQNLHNDRLFIGINGIPNGGKTLVYDLIKKEDNFIYLEISKHHTYIYEELMINQIGEENYFRLKPFIDSEEIMSSVETFFIEIGRITTQFKDKNFVVKPVDDRISAMFKKNPEKWIPYVKKYMPIKLDNIHFLFVVRHPKLIWAVCHEIILSEHMSKWSFPLEKRLWHTELVKLEELESNDLLKRIIKKTDLKKLKLYSMFDFYHTKNRKYDKEEKEILSNVEKNAVHNYKLLGYKIDDVNSEMFLKERKWFYENDGKEGGYKKNRTYWKQT